VNDTQDTQPQTQTRKREEHVSKDNQWRSFPKVPHLLQYVSNGDYYARIKVNGKIIRESLNTSVWTTAKPRLTDFVKKHQEARGTIVSPKFSEAVELFKRELESDSRIKPQSKQYRLWCLLKIQKSWRGLWDMHLDQITAQACMEWAAKLQKEIACHYYNNTIGTLKQVIQAGMKQRRENKGATLENPAIVLRRTKVKQKHLQLPEPSQLCQLVENLRKGSGGWGPRIGDLIEFLAYSGLRIASEPIWVTWKDIDWQRKEIIVRGHPETGTKNSEIRRVAIIADMERVLKELPGESPSDGTILKVVRCNEALKRTCEELGIPRLTHHDMRHLFATRCIESGVDIPTVSRWLGHKDGGALAMRTFGHLRNEHSQQMAQEVTF
jgi:integrase